MDLAMPAISSKPGAGPTRVAAAGLSAALPPGLSPPVFPPAKWYVGLLAGAADTIECGGGLALPPETVSGEGLHPMAASLAAEVWPRSGRA